MQKKNASLVPRSVILLGVLFVVDKIMTFLVSMRQPCSSLDLDGFRKEHATGFGEFVDRSYILSGKIGVVFKKLAKTSDIYRPGQN